MKDYKLPNKNIKDFTETELKNLKLWYFIDLQKKTSYTYCELLQSKINEIKKGK